MAKLLALLGLLMILGPAAAGAEPARPGLGDPPNPLPVGLYCPAPRPNPLAEASGFGLVVIMMSAMARQRARRISPERS